MDERFGGVGRWKVGIMVVVVVSETGGELCMILIYVLLHNRNSRMGVVEEN